MSISSQHEHAITNPVAGLGVGYSRGYWVATAHHRAECLTGNQSKYGGHPGQASIRGALPSPVDTITKMSLNGLC